MTTSSTFPGAAVGLGVTLSLLVAAAAGLPLSGSGTLVAACGAILVFGLPHGALDVEVIRVRGAGRDGRGAILAVYIGLAALTAAAWLVAPVAALAGFLGIAVIHFAEDWTEMQSHFLATGLAAALIAAPALLHRQEVAGIFVALTGVPAAARLADGLLMVAPVAIAVAAVGIGALISSRRLVVAAVAATSLIVLLALPPVPGFALFFCLFHSPRHFVGALRAARRWRIARWLPVVVPVTAAALAIVAGAYLLHGGLAMPDRLGAATFIALSILTVPHMLVPAALHHLAQQRASYRRNRIEDYRFATVPASSD